MLIRLRLLILYLYIYTIFKIIFTRFREHNYFITYKRKYCGKTIKQCFQSNHMLLSDVQIETNHYVRRPFNLSSQIYRNLSVIFALFSLMY